MLDGFKVPIKTNRNMYKYTHTLAVKVSQSDTLSHLTSLNMMLFLKPPQGKPKTLTHPPTCPICQYFNQSPWNFTHHYSECPNMMTCVLNVTWTNAGKIHNSLTNFYILYFSLGIYGILLGHFSLLWEFSPKKSPSLFPVETNTKTRAQFCETQYVNGTCPALKVCLIVCACVSVSVS